MKIAFVGKYPPIQGGVSAQTFWAVRGLAERGHDVAIVSNAGEVEDEFRMRLDEVDRGWLEPVILAGGGRVRLFQPEPVGFRMSHIPRSNPQVSKLAGLTAEVIREIEADLVVGSYFEPYAMSAALAASWTGRPLLVQHAGSDLDRLMDVPELGAAYREMLLGARGVITRPALIERFEGMGVPRERLLIGPPYGIPANFSPTAEPMSGSDIERLADQPAGSFDESLPTLGMYGKPGFYKGSFDFAAAVGLLQATGRQFNVVLLCGSSGADLMREELAEAGVTDRVWLLPFLPHWRVSAFIRRCSAVAFLERDFPVAIHGPVPPREILSCGTCLVLSGEIYDKQSYRDELRDGENVLLIADPKNHRELADRLGEIVDDPARARAIGARGATTTATVPDGDFVDAWESLIDFGVRGDASGCSRSAVHRVAPPGHVPTWFTRLAAHLDEPAPAFPELPDGDEADRSLLTSGVSLLAAAGRYRLARRRAARMVEPPTPIPNALGNSPARVDTIRHLTPVRGITLHVETFEADLTPIFCSGRGPFDPAHASSGHAVCFGKRVNQAAVEFRANDATLRLIEACDGTRTTDELIAALSGRPSDRRDGGPVAELLLRLHEAGIVRFTRPGVGPRPLLRTQPVA